MKTRFTIILFCIIASSLKAQTTDSTKSYLKDKVLNKIITALPGGWTFTDMGGEFIIELTDSIFVLDKRIHNIAINKKAPDDTILKYGYKSKSSIAFRYEPRWTYEQTLKAKSSNQQTYQLIRKLPEKYKISHLFDKSKSTRGNNVYIGKTDAEKEQVNKYEKEKGELLTKIFMLPNYNTEIFSLFILSTQGCSDDYFSVYPANASLQLYNILALFSELTEK